MTTLAGGAGLALLLAAAPVHAQLDLLRALLPQSAPFAGGQHMRRHADELAAIHREAAQGSPDAALRRAGRGGFRPGRAEVVVHGLCPRCAAPA